MKFGWLPTSVSPTIRRERSNAASACGRFLKRPVVGAGSLSVGCDPSGIGKPLYALIRNARCFAQIGVVDQLSQHAVRHVRPGYFGLNGLVCGVEPTAVHACPRAIGKHPRPHDDPVPLALLNDLLLDRVLGTSVPQHTTEHTTV